MPKLTIDGQEIEVDASMTVLQACEQAGIEIPRFCYHERLPLSGNCRMCLVEMERAPKPVASCCMPVGDGMVIHTNTEKVKKMREAVMEFLLINHPLDCPICDQGGECDLQDQAVGYGCGESRYDEEKRAVKDSYYGPLIRTQMTRCIHCTRCVRFSSSIAGTSELGGTFRGEHLEIGTYVGNTIKSELSGNMIDLCPVGALTNLPYAYKARSWELKKTESIDVLDGLGAAIRVDARGGEVLRVIPRLNDDVNEEWLGDKSRFACDGLNRQRLDRPYVKKDGKLTPVNWDDAFAAIKAKVDGLDGSKIAALAGDLVDVEAMTALKDLLESLGSKNMDCRQEGSAMAPTVRASYIFNSSIAGIEEADAILIVGSNTRIESPVLNARIRKRYLEGGLSVGVVGPDADLTYKTEHFGGDANVLNDIASGKHAFAEVLKGAEKPMIIVGAGALMRADGAALLAAAKSIADATGMVKDGWNGFNVLQTAASRVGGLDIGFVPGEGGLDTQGILDACGDGKVEVLYLLGADGMEAAKLSDTFIIYQGHHGDSGAHLADVILPGAAYTEKNATFVNTEGRVQRTSLAVFPPGAAKEDWAIVRALSGELGKTLSYNTLADVRARMAALNSVFATTDEILVADWADFGTAGELNSKPLTSHIRNYYMTDPISRASETMAACTAELLGEGSETERTGTDG
ncbi:NADH-quinone oxidoreductase subunit NuoG [Magnetovibrio sp. PR-2]|uniref:NADH-quinone oxidoreductase subunit NuoG n=1 Tax=Magnetovibrio sp. PR-2 TaxID=3120356 RepID=UPI002FCDF6D3